jgi:isochorismate synthase
MIFKFRGKELVQGAEQINTSFYSVEKNETNNKPLNFHVLKNKPTDSPSFTTVVSNGIDQIENGTLEKVVPSRYKEISIANNFDALQTFETLCEKHPTAMVSLFSSPQSGTWLGASPELLVSVDAHGKFRTHALAGTLPYSPEINLKAVAWTQKEIEEQALVCRYIINCFKKIRVREYLEHGPKTIVAGNVMHLKTDYEVDMKEINFPQLGSVMLKLLHPTSAVCGMPLEAALKFLLENEGYDREFYSGYLGPVNYQQESHIFVNLRCLQILEDTVRLYAGAGVTLDSIPQLEWEETEMKMNNMKGVITNSSL